MNSINPVSEPIIAGTVVAGTLDLSAALFCSWLLRGRTADVVLRGIAAGPFGDVMSEGGPLGSFVGLFVHYGIMAVIASVFVLAARRFPALVRHPAPIGLGYGVLCYLFMYWIVLPLRWPTTFPVTRPSDLAVALSFQLFFVGLPIALIAARYQKGIARRRDQE